MINLRYADWFLYYLISLSFGLLYIPRTICTRKINKKSYSANKKKIYLEFKNTLNYLELLENKYKKLKTYFKTLSIIPNYNLFLAIYLMKTKIFRSFLTFSLIKKIFIYNLNYIFGFFFSKKN